MCFAPNRSREAGFERSKLAKGDAALTEGASAIASNAGRGSNLRSSSPIFFAGFPISITTDKQLN